MLKRYYVATIMLDKKYEAAGFWDQAKDVLVVERVKSISTGRGLFKKETLVDKIEKLKSKGTKTLIETKNQQYLKHSPICALSDRKEDTRPMQDIYFEYFKAMYHAQEIDVGKTLKEKTGTFFRSWVKEEMDPKTGKITYKFNKFDNEFRAIVLMVALHVNPPKGVNHFINVEKQIVDQQPGKSRLERLKYALTKGVDDKLLNSFEARLEATQKTFEY